MHKGTYFLKEVDCIPGGFLTQCLLPLKMPCFPAGGDSSEVEPQGLRHRGGRVLCPRCPLPRMESSDSADRPGKVDLHTWT